MPCKVVVGVTLGRLSTPEFCVFVHESELRLPQVARESFCHLVGNRLPVSCWSQEVLQSQSSTERLVGLDARNGILVVSLALGLEEKVTLSAPLEAGSAPSTPVAASVAKRNR